jgi:predicted nucleotidyltransferase
MTERHKKLISALREKAPPALAEHVKQMIIFGSRARGDSTEDSDLDVLVLVDEKTAQIEQGLDDVAYQVMWDHDFRPIISLKVFAVSKYRDAVNKGFSFYKHIEMEGVAV